ncbi:uncharacterized protein CcaverHIS019_0202010 [Cutaneotrichosporon cavernicola]|uniref:FAD dependent oxidoreductase domain-containing protein n=1 Tax=Cutaneotrichosporon cavernicola TaxID=279322 RepID=A0AA48I098_9TREE|nr:uncharacterized protein CcaverHIS019_0202010 [Cutaneotrichosporon cavernicola]BEI88839.1 hypothetical protein CcaverHIS019_0202010 [Cutaneotrichosporon cavernicola]
MMGCALSYFLTRPNSAGAGKRLVCLEAKDVASGASGRNGGHVGPKTYALWHQLQQEYPLGAGLSPEEATWVMQNERDNLDLVESLVKTEGLDVDFWRGELLETHHDLERTRWAKEQYGKWLAQRRRMGLHGDDSRFVDHAGEAERLSRFRGVTSVHIRPGGSVHPAITPTTPFSGDGALGNTYNTLDGHYLVRTGSGELVLGGGTAPLVRSGKVPLSKVHGNEDDSEASIDPAITRDHAIFMRNFIGWGPEAYGEGLFAGHGMARIFAVARGYADTLKTGVWDEALLPKCFKITEERLARAEESHARWVRERGPACKVVEGQIVDGAKAKL